MLTITKHCAATPCVNPSMRQTIHPNPATHGPLFTKTTPSNQYRHSHYKYIIIIGRIYNGSVIQYWRSCPPSCSIGECAVPGLNAAFCFLWFTNCVFLFDKNLMLGCLWLLVFVLNNILILGIWCSTIPHLPGCFCPWTFFENIGFNTVLTDPFMSHLAIQLGFSAGELQALQLIVLAAFGVVD